MKKLIAALLLISCLFTFPRNIDAKDVANNISTDQELEENEIVINTMDDLDKMNEIAEQRYEQMLNDIPTTLKEKYESLRQKTLNAQKPVSSSSQLQLGTTVSLDDFLTEYPEYKHCNLEELNSQIELLRYEQVVNAVRTFFKLKGYTLSLTFFNHSLLPNPEPSRLNLTGQSEGMYSHIKGLLYDDGFVDKMVSFSRAGKGYKTLSDSHYAFNQGDLLWSIHGFTWKRTRATYDKAYFTIIDTYDFKKWEDIPGWVAGFSGTHDFDVRIYG